MESINTIAPSAQDAEVAIALPALAPTGNGIAMAQHNGASEVAASTTEKPKKKAHRKRRNKKNKNLESVEADHVGGHAEDSEIEGEVKVTSEEVKQSGEGTEVCDEGSVREDEAEAEGGKEESASESPARELAQPKSVFAKTEFLGMRDVNDGGKKVPGGINSNATRKSGGRVDFTMPIPPLSSTSSFATPLTANDFKITTPKTFAFPPSITTKISAPESTEVPTNKKLNSSSSFNFALPVSDKIQIPTFSTQLFDHHSGSLNTFTPPVTPLMGQETLKPVASVVLNPVSPATTPVAAPTPIQLANQQIEKEIALLHVAASSPVSLANQHVAQLDQIEAGIDTLATSNITLVQRLKELSMHVKEFDPVFVHIVESQTVNKNLITTCIEHIQNVDTRVKELTDHVKEFDPVFILLTEGQAVNKCLITTCFEYIQKVGQKVGILTDKVDTLTDKVEESIDSITALRDNVEILQEGVDKLALHQESREGIEVVVDRAVKESMSTFQLEVLTHLKGVETMLRQGAEAEVHVDEGFESDFDPDFEDEEDPLTQIFFPQGNGCWNFDKEVVRVPRGGEGLEKSGVEVAHGGERFEKGMANIGRGGGGGGGWCAVM